MVLMTDAGPITVPPSVDELIISGRIEEALEQWKALRAGCSSPEAARHLKRDIRMRIEYKLDNHADKLDSEVEAVKENLIAFLRTA
jgi:hypothetical protein